MNLNMIFKVFLFFRVLSLAILRKWILIKKVQIAQSLVDKGISIKYFLVDE